MNHLETTIYLTSDCLETQKAVASMRRFALQGGLMLISGEVGVDQVTCAHVTHQLSGNADIHAYSCHDKEIVAKDGSRPMADLGMVLGRLKKGDTLFLENIDALGPKGQSQLLAFCQTAETQYLMCGKKIPWLVIGTTTHTLETKWKNSVYHKELYWRLDLNRIEISPLRDRVLDLSWFLPYYCHVFGKVFGATACQIPDPALAMLIGYDFPGNFIELRAMIQNAMHAMASTGSADAFTTCIAEHIRQRTGHVKSAPSLPQAQRPQAEPNVPVNLEKLDARLDQLRIRKKTKGQDVEEPYKFRTIIRKGVIAFFQHHGTLTDRTFSPLGLNQYLHQNGYTDRLAASTTINKHIRALKDSNVIHYFEGTTSDRKYKLCDEFIAVGQ